jgi:hypothetical protein
METVSMKRLLMIAVVMCSVVAFGKDKTWTREEINKAIEAGLASQVVVNSNPSGATVTLDYTVLSLKTPVRLPLLKQGKAVRVAVSMDGYEPYSQTVSLDEIKGQPINIDVTLQAAPKLKMYQTPDSRYDHVGRAILVSIKTNEFAKYTSTVGNITVGCDITDTSVKCDEQKRVVWYELWLTEGKFRFDWAGSGASRDINTAMDVCNPLMKHDDLQFNFRYSKEHTSIFVPCKYLDKQGNIKESEARYTLTPW